MDRSMMEKQQRRKQILRDAMLLPVGSKEREQKQMQADRLLTEIQKTSLSAKDTQLLALASDLHDGEE